MWIFDYEEKWNTRRDSFPERIFFTLKSCSLWWCKWCLHRRQETITVSGGNTVTNEEEGSNIDPRKCSHFSLLDHSGENDSTRQVLWVIMFCSLHNCCKLRRKHREEKGKVEGARVAECFLIWWEVIKRNIRICSAGSTRVTREKMLVLSWESPVIAFLELERRSETTSKQVERKHSACTRGRERMRENADEDE